MLPSSSSTRFPLRVTTWTNPLIQSTSERQRQMRGMTSRTIDLDLNQQRNHSRPLRSAESPKRRHTANPYGRTRILEQSAPNSSPTLDHPIGSISRSIPIVPEEHLACEITMSYASTLTSTTTEKLSREEVIVMQQHSTGETSLVYRGYLTKGETFSFKSQRRPTSSLSLAFYVQGSINHIINECCEFKCAQNNVNPNDQKQFLFKEIQKANACEKCRKEHADRLLLNNEENTLLVKRSKKSSQSHSHIEQKHQQQKKVSKSEKANPNPPPEPKQSIAVPIKESSSVSTLPPIDTTKSEDKQEESKKPETTTTTIATDGTDHGSLLQLLAAQHGQNYRVVFQTGGQSSRMTRHPQSVENFCYILEKNLSISDAEQQTLRGLINFGHIVDDINSEESIKLLRQIVNEKIILIISKNSMENLSKRIQDEPLLCAIYVIHSEKISFDSKFYRGSFPDMTQCCQQMENDVPLLSNELTTISSIGADGNPMSTLIYVQALIDIVLQNDEKRDLKKEMIDFCREEYAGNVIQLKLIDQFEKEFQGNNAIQWYIRRETFVHKMLTRAFRVLDPDILFQLRYFIQHLHQQLKAQTTTSNSLTAYRTLRIRKGLFDKMKKNKGALLSFNEFLILDKNQSTSEPSPMDSLSELVRFQIHFEGSDVQTNKPNEILLTAGTIFRIDKVEQINQETFAVQLTSNADILKAGQIISKELRDAVQATFPIVSMIKLMKKRDLTGYIEYFCSILIDDVQAAYDEKANLVLGGSLHSLGTHYYEKKQYDRSLAHLRNALKVYLRVLPEDDVRLTPTYNNIGSIHHKQGLNEQALEYHRKAYEIQKNSKDPDMESISAYAGNIASVLMKLSRYDEAVNYLELDLQIKRKLHSNTDHQSIAACYHNLAGAQYRLHHYEKAVENYQKCLDIELKIHKKEAITVSVTYYNLATALEELGRLQEAKEAVEKAIARLRLTKKDDDEEIKMQNRYLQRLEQKIFMKSLF